METRNSFQTLFIFLWQSSLASIIHIIWEFITFEVWCSGGYGYELVEQKGKVPSTHTLSYKDGERPQRSTFIIFYFCLYCSRRDLSSPTRDWTLAPCSGSPEFFQIARSPGNALFSPLTGQLLKQSLFRDWGGLRQWIGKYAHCWRQCRLFSLCKGHLGCTHH